MKHRRGISLAPDNDDIDTMLHGQDFAWLSLETLQEWHVLGGKCSHCLRKGWVDRRDIERRFGRTTYLAFLRPFLRCRRCNNKGDNRWIIGKMAR